MALVDIVVVSYNSRSYLRACVEPLCRLAEAQVVVVDSASTDRTLEGVANLDVATVPLRENLGFAHACNVGWRVGEAPFVLFLNPDARIDEQSLRRLVEAVETDPTIGAAAPRIVGEDGSIDFSLRRFPRLRSTYAQALFLHRLFPKEEWSDEVVRDRRAYDQPGSPDWVSGACLLVRRAVLEHLGGLDEGFFLYCEDIDLCHRIRDAAFDIRYEPNAVATHTGGASAARTALFPILATSRARYAEKHQRRIVVFLERLGIALGALTHIIATRGGLAARRGHMSALVRALTSTEPATRHRRPQRVTAT